MFYFLKDYKKQKQEMLSEIKDLKITLETLKSLIQNANQNKAEKELEWFEDDKYLHSRYEEIMESDFNHYREFRNYAKHLKKEKKIKYIKENASLKIRQVHHGGCLSCTTPINEGIKSCLGCKYFNGVVSNYPDLSKKYSSEKDS
jgi:RNA polymerase-binding transcription factor DksA